MAADVPHGEQAAELAAAAGALADGRREEALARYRRIHGTDPRNHALAVVVADLYLALENPLRAACYYRRAARCLSGRGELEKARILYDTALGLCPDHVGTLRALAGLHLRLMRDTRELDVIAHHEARAVRHFHHLAEVYRGTGRQAQAVAVARFILRVQPHHAAVCVRLAAGLTALGRGAEARAALAACGEALSSDAAGEDALRLISGIRELLGRHPDGLATIYRLQAAAPEPGRAAAGLRGLYALHAAHPANPRVLHALGRTFAQRNRPAEAAAWFVKAYALDHDARPLRRMAERLSRANRPDAALHALLPAARLAARRDCLPEALALLVPLLRGRPHGPTLRVLYRLFVLCGRVGEALSCLEEYLWLCEGSGDGRGTALLRAERARVPRNSRLLRGLEELDARPWGAGAERQSYFDDTISPSATSFVHA